LVRELERQSTKHALTAKRISKEEPAKGLRVREWAFSQWLYAEFIFPFLSMAAQAARKSRRNRGSRSRRARKRGVMVFTRKNYVLLLSGLGMIVVGYIIMRMENEVDGFISLYIAPIILLAGYLEIIYAIMWRPDEANS